MGARNDFWRGLQEESCDKTQYNCYRLCRRFTLRFCLRGYQGVQGSAPGLVDDVEVGRGVASRDHSPPEFLQIADVDVIIGEGIQVVETAGNNPERVIGRLKAAGLKIIHKCTTVRHAKKAEELGCDVISIDGYECAGHPGEDDVGGLVLVPAAVNALKVPVIASGGIGDARGLVAALALGAEGVNMGTRFMLTTEAPVHENVKKWLLNFTERDTLLLLRAFRNTERVARTPNSERALEMERSGASIQEMRPILSGTRGQSMLQHGFVDEGIISIGQCIGLLHDIPTVKEFVDRIIKEATQIVNERLIRLVS